MNKRIGQGEYWGLPIKELIEIVVYHQSLFKTTAPTVYKWLRVLRYYRSNQLLCIVTVNHEAEKGFRDWLT